MKVGNEIDHLGTAEMEVDYSRGALRRRALNAVVVVGQPLLVCAAFITILALCVALA
jgi:hypothetical protein